MTSPPIHVGSECPLTVDDPAVVPPGACGVSVGVGVWVDVAVGVLLAVGVDVDEAVGGILAS